MHANELFLLVVDYKYWQIITDLFKVVPSSCNISCFDAYSVSLIREFSVPVFITNITAWVYVEGNCGEKDI